MREEKPLALKLKNISKRYGNQIALQNVTIEVKNGQTHALLGENGAGKSTMVNIISGCVKPDNGVIELFGGVERWNHPMEAMERGIATVFQEGSLVPDLKVYDNFLTTRQRRKLQSSKRSAETVSGILRAFDIEDVDPNDYVRDLPLNQKQKLEIVRALSRQPKVLLLDEAFSALTSKELEWFFDLLEKEKRKKTSIVIITHRLDEIKNRYEEFSILRNGEAVGTYRANELDDDEIIRLMLGHKLSKIAVSDVDRKNHDEVRLQVKNLSVKPKLKDADFSLHASEVLGIAGLDGQGQLELFDSLYGLENNAAGKISIGGKDVKIGSPIQAIENGIVYIPPNRKEGLFLELSINDNMASSILRQLTKWGSINRKEQKRQITEMMRKLEVKPMNPEAPVKALSGGNQQKVLLGKWLLRDTDVVMLYDPTRGVDVGTKYEINLLIKKLAEEGKSVLFHSTDIDEIVTVADRVLVFYRGRIVEELREDITHERILRAMTGLEIEGRTSYVG